MHTLGPTKSTAPLCPTKVNAAPTVPQVMAGGLMHGKSYTSLILESTASIDFTPAERADRTLCAQPPPQVCALCQGRWTPLITETVPAKHSNLSGIVLPG